MDWCLDMSDFVGFLFLLRWPRLHIVINLCCVMFTVNDSDVVDREHEHALLLFSYIF